MRVLFIVLAISFVSLRGLCQTAEKCSQSLKVGQTEIKASEYKIKKAENAYQLALNYSYLHYYQSESSSDFLTLPVILLNKKPINQEDLKAIKFDDIIKCQFSAGIEVTALYGTRGSYGLLEIKTKQE